MNTDYRKEPRFKESYIVALTFANYEQFIKKYPKYKKLSFPEFKEIIRTFNIALGDGMIDHRDGIEFPEGLGYLFMGTCPRSKKKNVDFVNYFASGVITTYKNWDSDNNLLKIFYTNYPVKLSFTHKHLWSFKPCKTLRHRVSVAYKKDWTKYIMVDPMRKISELYRNRKRTEYFKSMSPPIPETYNEFNL